MRSPLVLALVATLTTGVSAEAGAGSSDELQARLAGASWNEEHVGVTYGAPSSAGMFPCLDADLTFTNGRLHLACHRGRPQEAAWTASRTNDGDDVLTLHGPGRGAEARLVIRFKGQRLMKLVEIKQGKLDEQRYAEYRRHG